MLEDNDIYNHMYSGVQIRFVESDNMEKYLKDYELRFVSLHTVKVRTIDKCVGVSLESPLGLIWKAKI